MASGGRLSRIRNEAAQQAATNPQACLTEIWPDGIGRPAVRATLASMSRSTMSLKAQPAARISAEPRNTSPSNRTSGSLPIIAAASAIPCQPGSINSHIPTGRSNRPSFSQGRSATGAWVSTQFVGAASGRGAEGVIDAGLADLRLLPKYRFPFGRHRSANPVR